MTKRGICESIQILYFPRPCSLCPSSKSPAMTVNSIQRTRHDLFMWKRNIKIYSTKVYGDILTCEYYKLKILYIFFFFFWTLFLNLLRFLETYICTVYISKYKVEKNKLPITFFSWQKFTRHCQHSPLLIFCAKQLFPPPHETVFWVTVTRFS